jgi:hypothetical protein
MIDAEMKTIVLLLWLGCALTASAQPTVETSPATPRQDHKLAVGVADETGVPVASARLSLTRPATGAVLKGETDRAGRWEFTALDPGDYQLRVEKEGFYAVVLSDVRVGATESVEIALHHEQELRESVNVRYSPPAIDPAKTASSESLNAREIVNIPYSTTRDFRNVLRFIPGVLQDATGQVRINGSATNQILAQLDGFNITHPATGLLELRVSPDALRELAVQGSRYSAEYGKASGGVLSLNTGMGDDRWRFSATDFIPSVQFRKGMNFDAWTPRATLSGPLRKKRAWFFDALDGDFNLNIVNELPAGADRNRASRLNNLAKAQLNLRQAHILTSSLLVNRFRANHAGLSQFNPLETTRAVEQTAYLFTVKEQSYLSGGLLLEFGFGVNQYQLDEQPLGSLPYVVFPERTSGNFFRTAERLARRWQGIANLTLPSIAWRGRHEVKLGLDLDRIVYRQMVERRSVFIRRSDGTLARQVGFANHPRFGRDNAELSGFAQDRWAVTDRWLVETGARLDWDEIIRRALFSPRFASTYLLTRKGETKLAFGLGLFHDATNLSFITRPLAGRRLDRFFANDGVTPRSEPVETSFQVNEASLRSPRFVNWSAGLEQKLPYSIYLRAEFIGKRGSRGFTFVNCRVQPAEPQRSFLDLSNERRDRYDAATVTLRRTFKDGYTLFAAYTRSSARSNAVLDFSLDNLLFARQGGGPLAWDTPNRLVSWGWLPLIEKIDLAYALEWRDGFPFNVVNQDQQLVGAPNSRRFPDYLSLNLHAERKFRLLGVNLALRAGFNNLTNRRNATEVNNNVDSPQFLSFGGIQDRTFVGRIRFLGRK